jgi:hypothetical protein
MMDPAQEAAPEANEDQIVDQIGALLNQLSPEKQQMIIAQLTEMLGGGAEEAPVNPGISSPHAGANGAPIRG